MKTILVAIDGSDHGQRALELAADLASKYDGRLVVAHVADSKPLGESERHMADIEFGDRLAKYGADLGPETIAGFREAGVSGFLRRHDDRNAIVKKVLGEALLEAARLTAEKGGVHEVETVLEDGDAAQKIIAAAGAHNAGLIVLGSRGLGRVSELVLGSVSNKVNHLADVNVLTVK